MADDFIKFITLIGRESSLKGLLEFAQVLGRPPGWPPLYTLCACGTQMIIRHRVIQALVDCGVNVDQGANKSTPLMKACAHLPHPWCLKIVRLLAPGP